MSPSTPIRLVALDLDGTLLDSQSQISPYPAGHCRCRRARGHRAALHRAAPCQPAAVGGAAARHPVCHHLQRCRCLGYGHRPAGCRIQPLCRCGPAADSPADPASPPPHAAGDCPGSVCPLPGISWPTEHFFGRALLFDGTGMALFQNRHIQRHSTEARQPDDGRTHVVRDLDEWMSRHAHEVEKFCMFFDSIEIAQAALVRFRAFPGIEVVQGAPDNVEVTAAGVDKVPPCWLWPTGSASPGRPPLPSATATTTAPCWPGPVWPP